MIRSKIIKRTFADAAIDGLFSGFVSGAAMLGVIYLIELLTGSHENTGIINLIPAEEDRSWLVVVSHLALFCVYGAVYGVIYDAFIRKLPVHLPAWLAGLTYSAVLIMANRLLLFPEQGLLPGNLFPVFFVLSHLTYGLALGLLTFRAVHRDRLSEED